MSFRWQDLRLEKNLSNFSWSGKMSDDSLTCWYCEKRGFSAKDSIKVVLRKNLSSNSGGGVSYTNYLEEIVMIPRCSKCAEIHLKTNGGFGWMWIFVGIVIIILDVIAIAIGWNDPSTNWTVPIIAFVIGMGFIFFRVIQKALNKRNDQAKAEQLAEQISELGIIHPEARDGLKHPKVIALLSQGYSTQMHGDIS
jgi:hypothetical protein